MSLRPSTPLLYSEKTLLTRESNFGEQRERNSTFKSRSESALFSGVGGNSAFTESTNPRAVVASAADHGVGQSADDLSPTLSCHVAAEYTGQVGRYLGICVSVSQES